MWPQFGRRFSVLLTGVTKIAPERAPVLATRQSCPAQRHIPMFSQPLQWWAHSPCSPLAAGRRHNVVWCRERRPVASGSLVAAHYWVQVIAQLER